MKKLFLMLILISSCKAENIIFHAQPDQFIVQRMQEELETIEKRESEIMAQCIAYIHRWGEKEGIILARLLLKAEMDCNPHHTVFSIKKRLNDLGFHV